jgi:F-type H+-transporting ATPase subunit b
MEAGSVFSDATFWVAISFGLFVALLAYFRVPALMTNALDQRSAQIAKELDDARKLREEAQALLASYQRRQRDAEQEAEGIVSQARAEAERIAEETKKSLGEQLERRTRQAEEKIEQAEAQALKEVRNVAAEVAIAAAQKVIGEKIDSARAETIAQNDIKDVASRLN